MTTQDPIKSKRVPRFVEEYCIDRNGTRAAIRAGYSSNEKTAGVTAARLLADARVQALIVEQMERVSRDVGIEAADVLREWLAIATADPSKLTRVRRVNCRHCWGFDHGYQWSAREYASATDRAIMGGKPLPDCSGGFEWQSNAEPNPECPECNGEGVGDIFFADTESLTGPERKLFAGVKRTKDGLEIKMRDQDAALLNIAKHLGLLIERRELTGKDGKPLVPSVPPVDLPSDPAQLGALYTQIVGS